jgi:hypothetical protein
MSAQAGTLLTSSSEHICIRLNVSSTAAAESLRVRLTNELKTSMKACTSRPFTLRQELILPRIVGQEHDNIHGITSKAYHELCLQQF